MIRILVICLLICCDLLAKSYAFPDEPIDVIIPAIEKDLTTLNLAIEGIRANGKNIRRVIVISDKPLTNQAEWFDEALYPFDKQEIAKYLFKGNEKWASNYKMFHPDRIGWYYQQLLKLYAPSTIPGLSANVLALDADTIFLNPVEFLDPHFAGLYNPAAEHHKPYFRHLQTFLPGYKRVHPHYSGVAHHMLFQRCIVNDLFHTVENLHHKPFWQAFCQSVHFKDLFAGASEYEIYFTFAFSRTHQVQIRPLNWANIPNLTHLIDYQKSGYHYVSCHSYNRN